MADEARPTASIGRRWYVVQAQPTKEYVARREIAKRGFEAFLPECIEIVHYPRANGRGGRPAIARAKLPLFTGYLFVRFDAERDEWGQIGELFGVLGIVRRDDKPIWVDDAWLEQLRVDDVAGIWIVPKGGKLELVIGEPIWRARRRRLRQKARIAAGNLYLAGRAERLQQFVDKWGLRSHEGVIEALAG